LHRQLEPQHHWISDADKSVSAPIEMDFNGGLKNTFKARGLEFNYDVGVLQYFYFQDFLT